MESHGTPGRVQITRATYELVADDFECEPRVTIRVKGKGEMEIWHVLRRRPDASSRSLPATEREADAVAGG
jgi:guanylate cyclase